MADDPIAEYAPASDVCLLAVDFDASQLTEVRAEVSRQLSCAGLSTARAEEFLVAVSEAMTNAIRHGAGSGRVRLWRDGRVVCEVADDGAGFPAGPPGRPIPKPAPVGRNGGRGLWLTQELTDSMDIATGPDGTRIRLATGRVPDDTGNGRARDTRDGDPDPD